MSWFEEVYHPHWRQRMAIERVLVQQHTGLQEVLIFENATLGRVLVLDGIVQASERDEFIYHEMMTHVPIMAHGAARDVLIIGGGDGGALEEALKHTALDKVTMVELDPAVVEIARAWLPGIHQGAFDDPRAELLFTEAFYANCKARLRPGGILVGQSGNPISEPERIRACRERLAPVFADTSFILSSVPSYLGGPFVFAWGSDDPAKRRLSAAELAARTCPAGLRCYTPAVHAAAFVHPPWLADDA